MKNWCSKIILVNIILLLFLSGCHRTQVFEVPEYLRSRTQNVRVLSQLLGSGELKSRLESVKEEWPESDLELLIPSSSDVQVALQYVGEIDHTPDIFTHWPGPEIRNLIAKGDLAALDTVIQSHPGLFDDAIRLGLIDLISHDGVAYGLPLEITVQCLWVNQQLLDDNDWTVPETYDELLSLVQDAAEKGLASFCIPTLEELDYLFQFLVIMNSTGDEYEQPLGPGRDAYVQALTQLVELHDLGAFDNVQLDYILKQSTPDLFFTGRSLFYVQGSWLMCHEKSESSFPIAFHPFPALDSEQEPSVLLGLGNSTLYVDHSHQDEVTMDSVIGDTVQEIILYRSGQTNLPSGFSELVYSSRSTHPPDYHLAPRPLKELMLKIPSLLAGDIEPEELWRIYECHLPE